MRDLITNNIEHCQILRTMFNAQSAIGWDLFLRGNLFPHRNYCLLWFHTYHCLEILLVNETKRVMLFMAMSKRRQRLTQYSVVGGIWGPSDSFDDATTVYTRLLPIKDGFNVKSLRLQQFGVSGSFLWIWYKVFVCVILLLGSECSQPFKIVELNCASLDKIFFLTG